MQIFPSQGLKDSRLSTHINLVYHFYGTATGHSEVEKMFRLNATICQ